MLCAYLIKLACSEVALTLLFNVSLTLLWVTDRNRKEVLMSERLRN